MGSHTQCAVLLKLDGHDLFPPTSLCKGPQFVSPLLKQLCISKKFPSFSQYHPLGAGLQLRMRHIMVPSYQSVTSCHSWSLKPCLSQHVAETLTRIVFWGCLMATNSFLELSVWKSWRRAAMESSWGEMRSLSSSFYNHWNSHVILTSRMKLVPYC